jgi:hypothetical protein
LQKQKIALTFENLCQGSFTSAYLKSTSRLSPLRGGAATVVRARGLVIWGPPLDVSAPEEPSSSLSSKPACGCEEAGSEEAELTFSPVPGEGVVEGVMTAAEVFVQTLFSPAPQASNPARQRTLVFVAGRFTDVKTSRDGKGPGNQTQTGSDTPQEYTHNTSQDNSASPLHPGGLMMLDWSTRQWLPLCGVINTSSPTPAGASDTCRAPVTQESQGCGNTNTNTTKNDNKNNNSYIIISILYRGGWGRHSGDVGLSGIVRRLWLSARCRRHFCSCGWW